MQKKTKALQPTSLGAVRKAREALKGRAQELLDEFRLMIKQAAAAGKYEEALKAQQWLLDHVPAEDGERLFDPSSDKGGGSGGPILPAAPMIQLNGQFNLGGLGPAEPADPVLEAKVVSKKDA